MKMHNPAHPGELLQGWLSDLGLGVANTAAHLGIGRVTLSRILNGHAGISADIDLRLSEAFGTSPGYWLGMQAAHDVWQAKTQAKSRPMIKRFPDSVIETLHLISSPANAAKLASAVAQDRESSATAQENAHTIEASTTTATLPAGTVWDWATDGGISAHRISEYCSQQGDDEGKLLFQYVAAIEVTALRENIESNGEGAGFDVLHCVRKCGTHDLVMPEWLVYAFNQRYDAVNQARCLSWDDALSFGKPWPTGAHQKPEREKIVMPFVVWKLVNEAVIDGRSVGDDLKEEIAEKLGIGGKTKVGGLLSLANKRKPPAQNPTKARELAVKRLKQSKDNEFFYSPYLVNLYMPFAVWKLVNKAVLAGGSIRTSNSTVFQQVAKRLDIDVQAVLKHFESAKKPPLLLPNPKAGNFEKKRLFNTK